MTVAHKVVTVERQGGYAARCDTCGDITFGGFATRTEARAALAHEKKAPGAVQSLEGEAPRRAPTREQVSLERLRR